MGGLDPLDPPVRSLDPMVPRIPDLFDRPLFRETFKPPAPAPPPPPPPPAPAQVFDYSHGRPVDIDNRITAYGDQDLRASSYGMYYCCILTKICTF